MRRQVLFGLEDLFVKGFQLSFKFLFSIHLIFLLGLAESREKK
jgi:hypothetical protein